MGGPLETAVLDGDETAAVGELERRGLAERRVDGRRTLLDVAHPLHGEVVRAGLTAARIAALERRLADAVQTTGARRRTDVSRLAAWRLAAGGQADAALFEQAAEQALLAPDPVLAERFARAAGGPAAASARIWRWAGRSPSRGARTRPRQSTRRCSTGRTASPSASPRPSHGRATCSGRWRTPTRPTLCCARRRRPPSTPTCATS